eukprot:2315065-Pleurochrysis_carterae.AAC.2
MEHALAAQDYTEHARRVCDAQEQHVTRLARLLRADCPVCKSNTSALLSSLRAPCHTFVIEMRVHVLHMPTPQCCVWPMGLTSTIFECSLCALAVCTPSSCSVHIIKPYFSIDNCVAVRLSTRDFRRRVPSGGRPPR